MTAAEAVTRAREAGLTLSRDPGGLRVRGPKQVRAAIVPVLAPLVSEILHLLPPGENEASTLPGSQRKRAPAPQNRGSEAPTTVAPATPCDECGRAAWLFLLTTDGARTCVDCLTGRTAMRIKGVPL